jgi:UDP-N-acetylmuramoyl-tripeptide--D-alanyl-D-alanine ligase
MKLAEIVKIIKATENLGEIAEFEPIGFSIDSRSIRQGEIFFAIKGEKFDGHDFVASALERGALAVVVSRKVLDNSRLIIVDDVLEALQQLASEVLQRWNGKVIGITGSAGKTTTKELTALVLEAAGRVHKSVGNLNNAYGLPLSVLQMESNGKHTSDFDFAVLEMGMSFAGEIQRLCQIAPPDVGAVLNVRPVHLENFENIQGIANAKAELIEGLKPGGLAVLNGDDPLVSAMQNRHKGPVVRFAIEADAEISAKDIKSNGVLGTVFRLITNRGEAEVCFPLAGKHLLYNALVAACIGDYFGLTTKQIAAQLQLARPAYHRGEILRFKEGFVVIDDSYNSNPHALNEMVKMLAQASGFSRRIVVAGEMLELGSAAAQMHQDCGQEIYKNNVDLLIGVRALAKEIVAGALSAGMAQENAYFAETLEEATEILISKITAKDIVLIKASRGVKTEQIVEKLKEKFTLEKS